MIVRRSRAEEAHGRNKFQFYTAEMNRQVNERLKTETSLRRALERNEFEHYYQPRFNVTSGALVGWVNLRAMRRAI